MVYGALDGMVTTFAVVAGVAGAALSSDIILILGFANLLGDGVSMAAGAYLSEKSKQDAYLRERKKEEAEITQNPETEKEELRNAFRAKGFSGEELDAVVNAIAKHKEAWADTVLSRETNGSATPKRPLQSAAYTFAAFVIAGFIPLLAFVLALFIPFFAAHKFESAVILTGLAIFGVGSLRSLVIQKKWFMAGLEMLLVGGAAALVAFGIGTLIGGLI